MARRRRTSHDRYQRLASHVLRRLLGYRVGHDRAAHSHSSHDAVAAPSPTATEGHVHPVIIAGLDETSGGCLAVDQAASEARLRGAALRFVHVQAPTHPPDRRDFERSAGAEFLSQARGCAKTTVNPPNVGDDGRRTAVSGPSTQRGRVTERAPCADVLGNVYRLRRRQPWRTRQTRLARIGDAESHRDVRISHTAQDPP